MGVNLSRETSDKTENDSTDIVQKSRAVCQARCDEEQSNNVYFINGSEIKGDVNFSQTCQANASCTINNQIDANVANLLATSVTQNQTNPNWSLGYSVQVSKDTLNETIKNTVTNIIQTACRADVEQTQDRNIYYVSDSTIGGDLNYTQSGSANASCIIDNMSKTTVYNDVQSSSDQTQVTKDTFSAMIIAIVICVLIGIGILIFVMSRGKKGEGEGAGTTEAFAQAAAKALTSTVTGATSIP